MNLRYYFYYCRHNPQSKLQHALTNIVFTFIQQLIMLSASANKLSKLQEQAERYAALIMEELDPENLGYIEVRTGKREKKNVNNHRFKNKFNFDILLV